MGHSPKCPYSKVHGANMGPPGSCRPHVGPMLAPWTLLLGSTHITHSSSIREKRPCLVFSNNVAPNKLLISLWIDKCIDTDTDESWPNGYQADYRRGRQNECMRFRGYGVYYNDVIMGTIASLITSLIIVYSTVYSDAVQRNHQSSASLAFVWGIRRGPVNSPHKWPVTRKMFPYDDVIMSIPRPNWWYNSVMFGI